MNVVHMILEYFAEFFKRKIINSFDKFTNSASCRLLLVHDIAVLHF